MASPGSVLIPTNTGHLAQVTALVESIRTHRNAGLDPVPVTGNAARAA